MESSWPTKKLGEVAEIFAGSSAPQDEKYFADGKYPFFRVSDLSGQKIKQLIDSRDFVNDLAVKELRLTKAKKGSILFPKSGAAILTNSRAILGVDGYIVSHLAAVHADETKILKEWLFYFLFDFDMGELVADPAYPSLKISGIKEIEIPLPPIGEQRRIVKKLEKILSKIDKAKKLNEEVKEELDQLSQSVLHQAFGEKLV